MVYYIKPDLDNTRYACKFRNLSFFMSSYSLRVLLFTSDDLTYLVFTPGVSLTKTSNMLNIEIESHQAVFNLCLQVVN